MSGMFLFSLSERYKQNLWFCCTTWTSFMFVVSHLYNMFLFRKPFSFPKKRAYLKISTAGYLMQLDATISILFGFVFDPVS